MTAPYQPLNVPSKPQITGAATGRNQKDRRYMDTFWDTHKSQRFPRGRPWCGSREIAANTELMHEDGFCSPDLMQGEYVEDDNGMVDRAATFASTWTAPWVPVAKYFKFNYARKTISFEYAKMRIDEQRSLDEYYEAAAILGANLNVAVEYGVLPSFQIRAKIGNPTKFLKIAEAAIAGDPWLLGHIDEPNPELASILGFNTRGMRVTSYQPEPVPVVTPQQILATPQPELMKMIAEMAAQAAAAAVEQAMARRDAEQAKEQAKEQAQKPPKVSHKAKPKASPTASSTSKPAAVAL